MADPLKGRIVTPVEDLRLGSSMQAARKERKVRLESRGAVVLQWAPTSPEFQGRFGCDGAKDVEEKVVVLVKNKDVTAQDLLATWTWLNCACGACHWDILFSLSAGSEAVPLASHQDPVTPAKTGAGLGKRLRVDSDEQGRTEEDINSKGEWTEGGGSKVHVWERIEMPGDGNDSPREAPSIKEKREVTEAVIRLLKETGNMYEFEPFPHGVDSADPKSNEYRKKAFCGASDVLKRLCPGQGDVIWAAEEPCKEYKFGFLILRREIEGEVVYDKGLPMRCGESVMKDVREMICSGGNRTDRMRNLGRGSHNQVIELLKQVWGVGLPTAKKLCHSFGVRSIEALAQDLGVQRRAVGGQGEQKADGGADRGLDVEPLADWVGKAFRNKLGVESTIMYLSYWDHLHERTGTFLDETLGVETYKYELRRVPRSETEQVRGFIEGLIGRVLPPGMYEVVPCGSYRRGKPGSGDLDFLILGNYDLSDPTLCKGADQDGESCDVHKCVELLQVLVNELKREGRVKPLVNAGNQHIWKSLNSRHRGFQNGGIFPAAATFMGLVLPPGGEYWRRLDLWFHPRQHRPFAMMTYTGSAHFNRSMRLFCKRKGFSLNSYGVYKRDVTEVTAGSSDYSETPWHVGLVEGAWECEEEEDVFRLLGVKYVPPRERDGGIPIENWKAVKADVSGEDSEEEEEEFDDEDGGG